MKRRFTASGTAGSNCTIKAIATGTPAYTAFASDTTTAGGTITGSAGSGSNLGFGTYTDTLSFTSSTPGTYTVTPVVTSVQGSSKAANKGSNP